MRSLDLTHVPSVYSGPADFRFRTQWADSAVRVPPGQIPFACEKHVIPARLLHLFTHGAKKIAGKMAHINTGPARMDG